MRLVDLHEAQPSFAYGGKINGLLSLIAAGFPVPAGKILVLEQGESIQTNQALSEDLAAFMMAGRTYMVRSSAPAEDGETASFAGQYQSIGGCQTVAAVLSALETCLASYEAVGAQVYHHHWLGQESVRGRALLIQEEIQADYSGVSFAVHPLTRQDRLWYVEYVAGAGQGLVDGQLVPVQFEAAWSQDLSEVLAAPLSQPHLEELRRVTLAISVKEGRPMDVEFAVEGVQLWCLQARPMTRLSTQGPLGQWTTANFRDGGVAAQACPALMASLYDTAWHQALTPFLLTHQLVAKEDLSPLMSYHYARPYWNIGLVKAAMARIPGYIEREFDEELGVAKAYSGDGVTTRFSLGRLWHAGQVAYRLRQTIRTWQAGLDERYQKLLATYEELALRLSTPLSADQVVSTWRYLIETAYLDNETSYFKQVFINTVQFAQRKNQLLKRVTKEQFFGLVAQLGQVSHTQLLTRLQELAAAIRSDEALLAQWQSCSAADLWERRGEQGAFGQLLEDLVATFGYHSKRELYLLEPSFSEEPSLLMGLLQDEVKSPQQLSEQPLVQVSELSGLTKKAQKQVAHWVEELRQLLWWREAFKDLSTRYYHLIRQWTLRLGEHLLEQGLVECPEDLFYASWQETVDLLTGNLSPADWQKQVSANRLYCQVYDKALVPGELMDEEHFSLSEDQSERSLVLTGLSASRGQVTGRVRVLTDLSAIHQVTEGDILVTPFTDTGWSPIFGRLAGLITETGGVLCHASIVAREYGIPTLVCVKGACQRLKTGMLVRLDTATATVEIIEGD